MPSRTKEPFSYGHARTANSSDDGWTRIGGRWSRKFTGSVSSSGSDLFGIGFVWDRGVQDRLPREVLGDDVSDVL